MLAQKYRLHRQKDFERVLRYGRTLFQGPLKFKFTLTSLPVSRFGIVLSNKLVKNASGRNKIKRWIRAILIPLRTKARPGFDIAIICQSGVAKETFDSLSLRIPQALQKIGALSL